MKEYEHRRLACEHECKVGEKYVLPQAQAFDLSWSNAKDRGYSPRCTKECHLIATGWQSSPDPTGNQIIMEDQIVVPALALWLMQGSGSGSVADVGFRQA